MNSLKLQKPYLLVVVGLPGAGKTFFARQFSNTFRAPFIDYMHYQKLVGNEELGDVVATELIGHMAVTRRTLVIEGRGETRQDRMLLTRLGQSKGYETLFIWVQTEPQTAYRRAVKAAAPKYTDREYENQVNSFELLGRLEPCVVISGKHTFAQQAKMVLRKIAGPSSQPPATPTPPQAPQPTPPATPPVQPPVTPAPQPPASRPPRRLIMG